MLADAQADLVKHQRMIEQGARDMSIVYAMCEHFITRCVQRGDTDEIRQAVRWALDDTGIEPRVVRDFLDTSGLTDPAYTVCEYNVIITVPVTITLSVEASSDDEAEEFALNEAESNGLDSYYNEVDWYRAEIYDVESV
jgi:hypothetical protein